MTERHREVAAKFFNEVWALLGKAERTAAEDVQMIHLAHASRLHWQYAGAEREWAIGEWQIARVYAELGRGEPALYHADLAVNLTTGAAVGPFLEGCAQEVMARACVAAGRLEEARTHHAIASEIAALLADPEERDLLLLDLARGR